MISAVVLTKNEEKNIKDCLENLSWCDEIIVVDDFSIDKTGEIAEKMGAVVYKRRLQGDFAAQRNFGLKKAKGDLVFFVDADERVTKALHEEILKVLNCQIVGFYFRRKDKFLGKWLNYGEAASVRLLRLARKNVGKWQGNIHEEWQVKGITRGLSNPILHNRRITICDFLERINNYSTIRARQLFEQKQKTNIFWIIVFPTAKFLQNYFLRLGFLDGFPGFVMAFFMSFHSLLVRCKLYYLWQKRS